MNAPGERLTSIRGCRSTGEGRTQLLSRGVTDVSGASGAGGWSMGTQAFPSGQHSFGLSGASVH
jgi:hypothetical protein